MHGYLTDFDPDAPPPARYAVQFATQSRFTDTRMNHHYAYGASLTLAIVRAEVCAELFGVPVEITETRGEHTDVIRTFEPGEPLAVLA